MQNNRQWEQRATGSAKASPSERRRSVYTGTTRRPTGFSAPNAPRPSAPISRAAKPAQKNFAQKRFKQKRGRYKRNERPAGRWKVVLLAAGAALLLVLLAALIISAARGTYHQLPRVTRIEDYTPEPTAAPMLDATPEVPELFDNPFAAEPAIDLQEPEYGDDPLAAAPDTADLGGEEGT